MVPPQCANTASRLLIVKKVTPSPRITISPQKRQVLSDLMKYMNCTRTYIPAQVYSEADNTLNPYFVYLENVRHRSREQYWDRLGDMDDFVDLFIKTSRHFSGASKGDDKIRSFSDGILPEINKQDHQFNSDEFFRMILVLIGSWLLIEESFGMDMYRSPWMTSYCKMFPAEEEKMVFGGDISLRKLLSFPGDLLPVSGSPTLATADTEISRQDLNAYTLTRAGRIRLQWTTNITQHLTLKQGDKETSLMVFGIPCALSHPNSQIAPRYERPRNSQSNAY